MTNKETTKNYKWDISISLCKQDSEFVRKLLKVINPSLKVFFYEDRQEELIAKSGPEAFARVFKEESRIVIILSREEWSSSYYTDIERNAIIDRTAIRNEGYRFLMVIPMAQGEIPPWYPSTQIYVDPYRFTIEQIAKFIEFKVSEEGGIIKHLTVEDRYHNLLQRIEHKRSIIRMQESEQAIQSAIDEMQVLKNSFNTKLAFFRKKSISNATFYEFSLTVNRSLIGFGEYFLECKFMFQDNYYYEILTTQDMAITFEIFKVHNSKKLKETIEREERIFYYTPEYIGWAKPYINEQARKNEQQILFRDRDNNQFYDLQNPLKTNKLVDKWFQQFLSKATSEIEKFI